MASSSIISAISALLLLNTLPCDGFSTLHSQLFVVERVARLPWGGTSTSSSTTPSLASPVVLSAKKNKNKGANKGFAKTVDPVEDDYEEEEDASTTQDSSSSFSGLESINNNNKLDTPVVVDADVDVDPNAPTQDRTEQILRQRFGLKSYEEQQGDLKASEKRREARERKAQLEKLAAIDDGSFDIFAVLPPPLINALDVFLKAGLTISTILFVLAGIGITFEAYASATGKPLPENMDAFIVNTIEPNFTPGLLVLLAFSVSLGVFAAAQLGSASSKYQERP